MVRNYLVDQYCKSEVFGLNKIVDDFDYNILISSMVSICIISILLKKWVIFTLILRRSWLIIKID